MKAKHKTRTMALAMTLPLLLGAAASLSGQPGPLFDSEPNAGKWRTWVLDSGREMRLPPPPTFENRDEIQLRDIVALRTEADLPRIRYWDAGPPSYRWEEIALEQLTRRPIGNPRTLRAMALLNVAILDATIAAWDSKYAYGRPRPNGVYRSSDPLVELPTSPSYPSEHAVVAGAASEILASLYPDDAQSFRDRAEEAARSRLLAAVQWPSDVTAGLMLGRAVAARVLARAASDGSDVVWTGSIPVGPQFWNGTNPVEPLAGTWRPWVLGIGSELRPGPPPAYDSPQMAAELAEIKTFPRTFATNSRAFYWQTPDGVFADWYRIAGKLLFESHLEKNQPRAARVYALLSIAHYDALIACWDAKYRYWAIRPFQLDPAVTTLFPSPNHPSYPAAHGAASGAAAAALAYAFPDVAETLRTRGEEAGNSRIWAGIHFRSDVVTGLALGRGVAARVIARFETDGSAPPLPPAGITGVWSGSFETSNPDDCQSDPNAKATFSQTGGSVTGTIRTSFDTCAFGGDFTGLLANGRLEGTLVRWTYGPARVLGTATPTNIRLHVEDLRDGNHQVAIPGGTLDLQRAVE